jgi:hypothetical protein
MQTFWDHSFLGVIHPVSLISNKSFLLSLLLPIIYQLGAEQAFQDWIEAGS